jgi:hypothetical protein
MQAVPALHISNVPRLHDGGIQLTGMQPRSEAVYIDWLALMGFKPAVLSAALADGLIVSGANARLTLVFTSGEIEPCTNNCLVGTSETATALPPCPFLLRLVSHC